MKLGKKLTSIISEKIAYAGLIPNGIYELRIQNVDYRPSSYGSSNRAVVTFQVINGSEFDGAMFRNVFTIDNPSNPEAEKISLALFTNMLSAAGFTKDDLSNDFDTDLIIGRKVRGRVITVEGNSNYPQSNKADCFYKII